MKRALLILLLATACFGQGLTLRSPLRDIAPATSSAITDLSQIPNLFAYYKQDTLLTNLASNPASDTDNIRTWGDSSGNGRHLTTNRPATPPQYLANQQNGKGALIFNVSLMTLACGFTAQADTTIFVVAKPSMNASFGFMVDSTNASARQAVFKDNTEKFSLYSGSTLAGTALTANWYIFTAQFNSGGNDTGRTNSVQDMTGTSGTQSLDGLNIGSAPDGSSSWANGLIGCVAIYNRLLTVSEMDAAEALLGQQFGITTF